MGTIAECARSEGRDRDAVGLLAQDDQDSTRLKDWVRGADGTELLAVIERTEQLHDCGTPYCKLIADFALTLLSRIIVEVHVESAPDAEKGANNDLV